MAAGFAEQLLAAARQRDIAVHPFVLQVQRGEASRESVREYATITVGLAEGFPRVLCSILAVCDHPVVRRAMLGNLLEEEGVVAFVPEEGVQIDPALNHGAMASLFARAAGATDEELARAREVQRPWFTARLSEGDWMGPFSYVSVGIEASVPHTLELLVPALQERYGFTPQELRFLTEHLTADVRHGEESAALIAEVARTPELRAQALEGARRGGMAWWELHRRFVSRSA